MQRPITPLGAAIERPGLQGPVDHLGHLVALVSGGAAWPEFIGQAIQSQLSVALAPLADGYSRQGHALGN